MKYFLFIILGLLLTGCNNDRSITIAPGAHNIKCEGLEKTTGLNIEVTEGKNIIIRYKAIDGEGLIIAGKCMIE